MKYGYCRIGQFVMGCGRIRRLVQVRIGRVAYWVCSECADRFAARVRTGEKEE